MRRLFGVALCGLILLLVSGAAGRAHHSKLLFHMETMEGKVICSQRAGELFNPASVIKVGTTLWALERLGPAHRYETVVGYRGSWNQETGTISGALVVVGGGDPDLHTENIILIARELNRLGVRRVTSGLVVSGRLTVGWEHGVARRDSDERRRGRMMGERFVTALDPSRWHTTERACWEGLCERRGWEEAEAPGVVVEGAARVDEASAFEPLLRHLSNPLPILLKRFNVYSNNDIIRVADGLGGAAALQAYLRTRLDAKAAEVQVATASGEERNRMTARLAVRLMRATHQAAVARGLELEDLLPVPGCDPGPVPRMFPMLASGSRARTVACKTGTLRTQDGGVAVLAGTFVSDKGEQVLFCVAAPGAGRRLNQWRRLQQSWLLGQMEHLGTTAPASCPDPLPFSDTSALVQETASEKGADPLSSKAPEQVRAADG